MTAPKRIQRKRSKGWVMPPNTVYVGRPGKWGNIFVVTDKYPPGTQMPDGQSVAAANPEQAIKSFRLLMRYVKCNIASGVLVPARSTVPCRCAFGDRERDENIVRTTMGTDLGNVRERVFRATREVIDFIGAQKRTRTSTPCSAST